MVNLEMSKRMLRLYIHTEGQGLLEGRNAAKVSTATKQIIYAYIYPFS